MVATSTPAILHDGERKRKQALEKAKAQHVCLIIFQVWSRALNGSGVFF